MSRWFKWYILDSFSLGVKETNTKTVHSCLNYHTFIARNHIIFIISCPSHIKLINNEKSSQTIKTQLAPNHWLEQKLEKTRRPQFRVFDLWISDLYFFFFVTIQFCSKCFTFLRDNVHDFIRISSSSDH